MAEPRYLKQPLSVVEQLVSEIYPKFLETTLTKKDINLFIRAFQLDQDISTNEIPYDVMTAIIFQSDIKYDAARVNNNIDQIGQSSTKNGEPIDETTKSRFTHYLNKISNHTVLAFTQKREFARVLDQARRDTKQLSEDIEAQKEEVKAQKTEIDAQKNEVEVQKAEVEAQRKEVAALTRRTKRISIEFTTVLGIFTSIVFALFGGVQVISGLLGRGNDLAAEDIGNAIFLAAVATTLVYLLLIALLSGIGKLTETPYEVSGKVTAVVFLTLLLIAIVGVLYGHPTASGQLLYLLQRHSVIVPAILVLVALVIIVVIASVLTGHWKSLRNKFEHLTFHHQNQSK
ncbi:hypothetical protein ACFQ5J_11235 [Lacticaseibacillus baoqingensis]|uniref:Uncharacterized protein n=1 Tax=Lacticaseibacillus baoqingensis TaxID=2486013 RepID=A0ABW4EBK3_9LACO|nr:hypothetical protein [Lacticaseibacillus baoqingensis]